MKKWVPILAISVILALMSVSLGSSVSVSWQVNYEMPGQDLATLVSPAWDGILLVGDEKYQGVWSPLVLFVDPETATVIWSLDLSSQHDRALSDFAVMGDLAYLVGYNNDTNGKPNLWVVAVNSNGEVVAEVSIGLPDLWESGASVETDGQYLYIAGMIEISTNFYRAAVWVMDGNLNVIRVGMPNIPGLGSYATSIALHQDGILISGASLVQVTEDIPYTDGFVALLEYENPSNTTWFSLVDLADKDLFIRVKADDGSCFVVGGSENYTDDAFGYVLSFSMENGSLEGSHKVDSNGDDIMGDLFVYGDVLYVVGELGDDSYIARLGLDLGVVWEESLDMGGSDFAVSLYVCMSNKIYVLGVETESDPDGDLYLALVSDHLVDEVKI